jgi:hypothetical protein
MLDAVVRERGGPEVAFALLRFLTMGYCLWGVECDVSLAELPRIVRAVSADLARAIIELWDLNLVLLDQRRHTIRLSPHAVEQLIARRAPLS